VTNILLVEDSSTDAFLIQEALRQVAFDHRVEVVTDGVQAIDRLRGGTRPDLVLLDLNLPRKDGREVLAEVKGDPELRSSRSGSTGSSRRPPRSATSGCGPPRFPRRLDRLTGGCMVGGWPTTSTPSTGTCRWTTPWRSIRSRCSGCWRWRCTMPSGMVRRSS
jgi:CheY-like chemotaxis protein